jgi:arylsulfatase
MKHWNCVRALALVPFYLAVLAVYTHAQQSSKPNIVFILVDNVGWGDFGVYGGTTPPPRIDKMAHEGIRFLNYNVEAQCTPSRSAIMTGRMSVRSGTYTVPFPGQGASGLWLDLCSDLQEHHGL